MARAIYWHYQIPSQISSQNEELHPRRPPSSAALIPFSRCSVLKRQIDCCRGHGPSILIAIILFTVAKHLKTSLTMFLLSPSVALLALTGTVLAQAQGDPGITTSTTSICATLFGSTPPVSGVPTKTATKLLPLRTLTSTSKTTTTSVVQFTRFTTLTFATTSFVTSTYQAA